MHPPFRRLRSLSLVWQLIILATVPALIAGAVIVSLTTRQHLSSVATHVQTVGELLAQQLAVSAQAPMAEDDRRALTRLADATLTQPHMQLVQIWSPDGELLALAGAGDLRTTPGIKVTSPVLLGGTVTPGQVALEIGLDELREAESNAWTQVLLAIGLYLLAMLLACLWAVRRISAPIARLATAVDRLSEGEPAQVDLIGPAEVQRLQAGFNGASTALADGRRLLEQRVHDATAELALKNRIIEQTSQAKTRLLAAASHDLRQPLQALALFTDRLALSETEPAQRERIRYMQASVASLDQLFVQLLDISQIDAGVLRPRVTRFALERVLDEVDRNFRSLAEAKALRLVVRHTDVWVTSDYFMLSRVVGNLVANAVRYTAAGGVLVAARRRGGGIRIDVVDTGEGIAQEHQGRVFEEFFKVDGAAGVGLGLGLATVQRLSTLLGVGVSLRSTLGRGSWFRLDVPGGP